MIVLYAVEELTAGGRWHVVCMLRDGFDANRLAALRVSRRVRGVER